MVPKIIFLLVVLVMKAPYRYDLMARPSSGPEGGRQTERGRENGGTERVSLSFFAWLALLWNSRLLVSDMQRQKVSFWAAAVAGLAPLLEPTLEKLKAECPSAWPQLFNSAEAFLSRSSRTALAKSFNFLGVSVQSSNWGCVNLIKEHNRNPFFLFH